MFTFDFEKTKEKYYTAIPSPIIDKMKPWLDRVLEYEIVIADDAPDEVPRGCFFRGRWYMLGYAYVYANIRPEDLIKAAETIHRMRAGQPTHD